MTAPLDLARIAEMEAAFRQALTALETYDYDPSNGNVVGMLDEGCVLHDRMMERLRSLLSDGTFPALLSELRASREAVEAARREAREAALEEACRVECAACALEWPYDADGEEHRSGWGSDGTTFRCEAKQIRALRAAGNEHGSGERPRQV